MTFWSLEHIRLLLLIFFGGCGQRMTGWLKRGCLELNAVLEPLGMCWNWELVPWLFCSFYLFSAQLHWICRDYENFSLGLIWGALWLQNWFLPFYNFLLIIPLAEVDGDCEMGNYIKPGKSCLFFAPSDGSFCTLCAHRAFTPASCNLKSDNNNSGHSLAKRL